jgi:tRNA U34 5-carboxymethylaminomethyl modifying enzyme MnmG/GidA
MTLPGAPEPIAHAQAIEQLDILAKYQGYIDRQQDEVERHRATEDTRLPEDIDYAARRRPVARGAAEAERSTGRKPLARPRASRA